MELQEDAYRVKQVFNHIDIKDIILFLRTKTPNNRCQLALKHFLTLENDTAMQNDTYKSDLQADFLCLRHLLKSVTDEEIKNVLQILGPIENRKQVAVRMLLNQDHIIIPKKRRSEDADFEINNAVSNNKLIKSSEFNGIADGMVNFSSNENIRQPLRLRIKNIKDSNGNVTFKVTTASKSILGCLPTPRTNLEEHQDPSTSDVVLFSDRDGSETCPNSILNKSHFLLDAIEPYHDHNLENQYNATNFTHDNLTINLPTIPKDIFGESTNYENTLGKFDIFGKSEGVSHQYHQNEIGTPKSEDSQSTIICDPLNEVVIEEKHDQSTVGELEIIESPPILDLQLVSKLVEMFPNASSEYIHKLCHKKDWNEQNFNEIVEIILSAEGNYPQRPERQPSPEKEINPEEQLNTLRAVLPDADPTYLAKIIEDFGGNGERLAHFIAEALEKKDYPTMKEYLRKQQLSAQQRQYTADFDVSRFVELFPDPVSVFENPDRKTTILNQVDKYYVKWFMRTAYNQLYVKQIYAIIDANEEKNIFAIIQALNTCLQKGCYRKIKINPYVRPDTQNIPLLQELAYFEHKNEIIKYITSKKIEAEQARQNAKEMGLLHECSCCYDVEIMPNDILTCMGGCRFCRDCIKRGTEVAFGEGKLNFPCFKSDCDTEFSLQVLQNVLPPKLFSKLAQKKALAEVKAAGVEDLETCPFCDFASIPAPEDKLFRCLNPDCMKESCRQCKEPSHIPYHCDEVEKDESVKARTYIENKMTEALVRECWKCSAKFIKEDGCNKMTCSCGAMMCYLCRQPVKDYKHFNGQGGDKHDLCPLYTDNYTANEKNVVRAAFRAKKEVDANVLKIDPTANLKKHTRKKSTKNKLPDEFQGHIRMLAGQHLLNAQFLRRNHVPFVQHVVGNPPVNQPNPFRRANELLAIPNYHQPIDLPLNLAPRHQFPIAPRQNWEYINENVMDGHNL